MDDDSRPDAARSPFARATAVRSVGAGRYAADLDGRWAVGDKLNGGYLAALTARAAVAEFVGGEPGGGGSEADVLPVGLTVQYLEPPSPGPAELAVALLGRTRRTGHLRVTLSQGGRPLVEALVTTRRTDGADAASTGGSAAGGSAAGGSQEAGRPTEWRRAAPPSLPAESQCPRQPVRAPGAPFDIHLAGMIEQRLDPECLGFAVGKPSGAGELRGWARIPGEESLDAAGLLLIADSFPPAVFDLGHQGWVPTLSLTVHLLALPVPGALRVRQRVQGVGAGVMTQTCELWDEKDRLVAHAVQVAVLPRG